jgi:hypothetical protein
VKSVIAVTSFAPFYSAGQLIENDRLIVLLGVNAGPNQTDSANSTPRVNASEV